MVRWKVQSDYARHGCEGSMKVGDLVKNLNSESRQTGIIIEWSGHQNSDPREGRRDPVVLWADGRCSWILRHRVEVLDV